MNQPYVCGNRMFGLFLSFLFLSASPGVKVRFFVCLYARRVFFVEIAITRAHLANDDMMASTSFKFNSCTALTFY